MIGITSMSKEVFHHSAQICHIFLTVNQPHEIQDFISSELFDSLSFIGSHEVVLYFYNVLACFNTRLILLFSEKI